MAGASHVDSVLDDGSLLGARMDGGVAIRPPNCAVFSRVERVVLPTSAAIAAAYYAALHAELGKPYDVEGIAAFIFGRDWRDPGHWYCSELVGAKPETSCYFQHKLATASNRLTPPDLLLVLSGRPDVVLPSFVRSFFASAQRRP